MEEEGLAGSDEFDTVNRVLSICFEGVIKVCLIYVHINFIDFIMTVYLNNNILFIQAKSLASRFMTS